MPFAPVILKERAHDYLVSPKNVDAPFMMVGVETTPLAHKELLAALHRAGMIPRPQVVERSHNPRYYDIIKAFENLTGAGGAFNASFNLHGYPIVMSPEDALHVFENSGLDMLFLEDTLIVKRLGDSA